VHKHAENVAGHAGEGVPAELSPVARGLQRKMHQTIRKITLDFEGRWHFNTCIAAVMELTNELYGAEAAIANKEVPPALLREMMCNIVLLLAPMAPYLSAELWSVLGENAELLKHPWPTFDAELAKETEVEMAVQINGKLRAKITVAADAADSVCEEKALADEKIKASLDGKKPVKILVVKGRLVNIVVK